ncbi:hypothetical protein MML48_1g13169 [Holotrichia oblita]|uniref:Uncharacterized protein n=1 Tax=Holotrichia oblita TaxID=644536 RepID=A0ACB9TSV7_HOLOL|nr:hypothetical protein MML48_1g13169 [Holotrichia oblita]
MASWYYEEEQRRLQCLFDEVETDPEINEDSDTDVEEDQLEIQPEGSESEQDMSDEMQQDTENEHHNKCREPCFFGSDSTRRKKHLGGRRNVRTRVDNIIT